MKKDEKILRGFRMTFQIVTESHAELLEAIKSKYAWDNQDLVQEAFVLLQVMAETVDEGCSLTITNADGSESKLDLKKLWTKKK